MLARWRQREEELTRETCTPVMLREQIEGSLDIAALFDRPQDEIYMTVHPNGDLFVGNTGAETECLGSLMTLDVREAAKRIRGLPGNRDYGAFYDRDRLPGREEFARALARLPRDLLYSDRASAVCRALAEIGIPTRIPGEAAR